MIKKEQKSDIMACDDGFVTIASSNDDKIGNSILDFLSTIKDENMIVIHSQEKIVSKRQKKC